MGRLCSKVQCLSFLREKAPLSDRYIPFKTAVINFLLNMNKSLNQEVFLTSSQSKMYWLVFFFVFLQIKMVDFPTLSYTSTGVIPSVLYTYTLKRIPFEFRAELPRKRLSREYPLLPPPHPRTEE